MSDRSEALLSELQAVCQRILTSENRGPAAPAALTNLASVANGTAVASSLEALRRQCVDNHDQVAELKRSIDAHRGVVAGDSAANGKMLVDLGRSIASLTNAVEADRSQHGEQIDQLSRSVESLRVGLSGSSANNRQQVLDLRGTVESMENTISGFGEQVQHALTTMGDQFQAAVQTLSEQITVALRESNEQAGREMSRQADAFAVSVTELRQQLTEVSAELSDQMAGSADVFTAALAEAVRELTGADSHLHHQLSDQTASLAAASADLREQMAGQALAYDALTSMLEAQHTKQRLDALESMLIVGLPKFSEDIQAGVQSTLLEVGRTFRMAEREHGNRMVELHRDFDITVKRLEAALQPRLRDKPASEQP